VFYVISYDVVDDARRNRVSEALLDYGKRVQYSVFECSMGEDLVKEMTKRLQKIVKPADDRVRIYPLCGSCRARIQWLGTEGPSEEPKVVII
jgi:CRISPR-associated protein Cas2